MDDADPIVICVKISALEDKSKYTATIYVQLDFRRHPQDMGG